jgi:hypothetical protein
VGQTFPVAINVEHPIIREISNGTSSPSILAFGNRIDDVDPEEPLPTYEIQPAMLAVDLSLGPGESRSCGFFFRSRLLFRGDQPVNINRIW